MVCNKMYFSSKKDAAAYITNTNKNAKYYRKNKSRLAKLTPYCCFHCDGWHLTSMSQKETKKFLKDNKQRGRDLKVINSLRAKPTIENLLDNQRPWIILHIDDTRYWITFSEESGFDGRIVLT